MTAMNAWTDGTQAAFLLTDTAVYDADGVIIRFASKTITLSGGDFHAAIGLTGDLVPEAYTPLLAELPRPSLRFVLTALPSLMKRVEDIAAPILKRQIDTGLVVAAWHRGEGASVWGIANTDEGIFPTPYQAYAVARLNHWLTGNGSHPAFTPDRGPSSAEATAVASELIQAQRREPWPNGLHLVGGDAYLTEVSAAGCKSQLVGGWFGDYVGEKCDPDAPFG